jgi:ABC-type uncharacterized transport system YnjBCD ATPase subunit
MSYTLGNITITPSSSSSTVLAGSVLTASSGTYPTYTWSATGASSYSTGGYQYGNVTIEKDDIVLNDVSIKKTLTEINERLAMLVPDPRLEEQFAVLKNLRLAYDQEVKKIKDQMKMWDVLKDSDL